MTPSPWFDADLSPAEFRALGRHAIDMISDYYEQLRDLPVYPAVTGVDVESTFDEPLPLAGQDPKEILDSWRSQVIPNSTHVGSPRYFGFVNGSGSMMGVLADALAASVNMNPGAWKPAPAATEIERRCIHWLAEMIGYSPECGGLLTSGGTMANFTALTTALRSRAGVDIARHGVQSPGRWRVYMTDHEGHVSVTRVAGLMGLGADAVRRVPSRSDLTMDVDGLRRMLDEDTERGDLPFCVVAQVGSVNLGAIDPLPEIADLCAERGLWFHADGASGAIGAALPEMRHLYKGLERADSVTLDPHKWLYIPYECGSVLVRRPEHLLDAFSMTAPYLRGETPTEYDGLDYLEYGPQMSRGFRALKLWMTLKHYGVEGYRRLLRQNILCAQRMHELASSTADFEPAAPPRLFIYAFRFAPQNLEDMPGDETREQVLDRLNQEIADRLQLSGEAFVMTSRIAGKLYLRFSICSHRTTFDDIDRVFEAIRGIASELEAKTVSASRGVDA